MISKLLKIKHIPAILWGEKVDRVYIFIHGKKSYKEDAKEFTKIAAKRGVKSSVSTFLNMETVRMIDVLAMSGTVYNETQ